MSRQTPPVLARFLLRLWPLGERRSGSRPTSSSCSRRGASAEASDTRGGGNSAMCSVCGVIAVVCGRGVSSRGWWLGTGGRRSGRRVAARLLRRSPGVVAVTIVGLGLAIGVGTSVFSLLNAIAFRGTGIDDPATAVRVFRGYRTGAQPPGHTPITLNSATRHRASRSRLTSGI
jgi:hypothetical protein